MRRSVLQHKRSHQWGVLSIAVVSACIVALNIRLAAFSHTAAPTLPATQKLASHETLLTPLPSTPTFVNAEGKPIDPEDEDAWRQDGITWFTILNDKRYYWCDTLASAFHNNITMNIWGWGNKEFDGWLATWLKIPLAIEFSEGLEEDDLMGFVDGADTLFQSGIATQMEELKKLREETYNFVMSTEINCAVQSLPKHGCAVEGVFPETPWGKRYLNSGLYLGNAGKIREFLQFVEKYYLPRYKVGTVQRNDQSVIGKAWHDGWRKNFTLDAYTNLFQSVRMAEGHYCQTGADPSSKLPLVDKATQRLKNCLTNNTPSVFHFNGKAKPFLEKWIVKFWWHGRKLPPNAVVFLNKKPTSLKKLCPKLKYSKQ